jgi:hypothetical protein
MSGPSAPNSAELTLEDHQLFSLFRDPDIAVLQNEVARLKKDKELLVGQHNSLL